MKTLMTNRLILRPFKENDAESMYKNWTYDERAARYCRWYPHQSIKETKEYLKICMSSDYCWAITFKDRDETIGCIDLTGKNSEGIYEIGYVLSFNFWNQGIMSEALKAVIDYLFENGFEALEACHMLDNPASGRVMEKAGMHYVRNGLSLKKFGSDELVEVKYYGINKKCSGI